MRLRIKDIDFESTTVTIHSGKGDKDRIVMLPKNIKPDLKEHISPRITSEDLFFSSDNLRAIGSTGVSS